MKRIFWGRPTRFFSAAIGLFLLLCVPLISFSGDILTPDKLSPELTKKIEEAVESFSQGLRREEFKGILERTDKEARKAIEGVEGEEGGRALPEGRFDWVYYFFSFSMPEEVILGAMKEAVQLNRLGRERVRLVLRGFARNSLKETVRSFLKYIEKIGEDIPVEVDPELFDRFAVKAVPQVWAVKGEKTGGIKGDLVSISYALSRFEDDLREYGSFGRLYPIREENALEVFARKQKEIEQRLLEKIPEIRGRMLVLTKYDGNFEHAKEDRVYYIDPSIVLAEDILDHEGRVIAARGTVYNPSDRVRLGRYVVIDGNCPKQVEFALRGNFRKILLISGNLEKLVKTYRVPFYFVNDQIMERFKIRRVPLIIEGDGEYVKLTEKAVGEGF